MWAGRSDGSQEGAVVRTKIIALLGFAALVLLAGPAMAQQLQHEIKHPAPNNPRLSKIADMPMAVGYEVNPVSAAVTGPVAAASDTIAVRGAALVSPAGGSVYTPEQRANAEIRQLIRRLDG